LPATTDRFVVDDKFVVNTNTDAAVRIRHVDSDFQCWFGGKTEEPMPESKLDSYDLCCDSRDKPILAALSGPEQAETTLAQMYSLMEKQRNGEEGVLLNNSY